MIEGTHFWMWAFGSFFIGMSIIVLITGWLAERRRKHRWAERCEDARRIMIEREKIEKRGQSDNGAD